MRFPRRQHRPTVAEQKAGIEAAEKSRRAAERAAQIEELFAHMERLEPCPDPGCMAFRATMRRIMLDED